MGKEASRAVGTHLRSNVIGYVAVFIALSGTAYAANKVDSNEIARNAVLSKHVKKGAVRSPDVKDNGLRPKDVRGLTNALKTLKQLQAALGAAGGYFGKLQGELDALTARVAALEGQGALLPGDLDDIPGQLDSLQGQVDSLVATVGGLNVGDLDQRLDAVCTQLESLTNNTGAMRDALAPLVVLAGVLNGVTIPAFDETLCQG